MFFLNLATVGKKGYFKFSMKIGWKLKKLDKFKKWLGIAHYTLVKYVPAKDSSMAMQSFGSFICNSFCSMKQESEKVAINSTMAAAAVVTFFRTEKLI